MKGKEIAQLTSGLLASIITTLIVLQVYEVVHLPLSILLTLVWLPEIAIVAALLALGIVSFYIHKE